ncbi:major facilitator superfamily transporter [Podospora didyma]|uniref:Molybdate-anion transporter n=1 Tax=Podospora didyma TaxID=330526 RepID=A0AAE0NH88_9PEZI|nr:major facilitator superfamily transporter [Podospora didyma]
MNIYTANLAGLLALCGALFAAQGRRTTGGGGDGNDLDTKENKVTRQKKNEIEMTKPPPSQRAFLVVYALVMAADWLQGPYLYSLYREEHGVSPSVISTLFTTGFVSGAISGSFIGSVADRRGRKAACLVFCVAYAASCILTVSSPAVPLLFLGRVLGGLATSLLFTVFESWMVTDARRHVGGEGGDLSRTFGLMSTLNSVVAILSGVSSEWLVGVAGTRKAPFAASAGLLVVAFGIIWTQWQENYGETGTKTKTGSDDKKTNKSPVDGNSKRVWAVLTSPRVLSLGLASTVFEGSMYLFVFFWTPALKSVSSSPDLPYGVIFASFMAATLASSLAFSMVSARHHASLLLGILGGSAACFFLSAKPASEQSAFWVFCLFEAAVGMYWPCMGCLRGGLVDDGIRAQVYGMLRVPLNVFVVVSLLLTGNGDAYGNVFLVSATLLLASSGALWIAGR